MRVRAERVYAGGVGRRGVCRGNGRRGSDHRWHLRRHRHGRVVVFRRQRTQSARHTHIRRAVRTSRAGSQQCRTRGHRRSGYGAGPRQRRVRRRAAARRGQCRARLQRLLCLQGEYGHDLRLYGRVEGQARHCGGEHNRGAHQRNGTGGLHQDISRQGVFPDGRVGRRRERVQPRDRAARYRAGRVRGDRRGRRQSVVVLHHEQRGGMAHGRGVAGGHFGRCPDCDCRRGGGQQQHFQHVALLLSRGVQRSGRSHGA